MSTLEVDAARAHERARLVEVEQGRRARQAAVVVRLQRRAERLSQRAERTSLRAERAAARARLALARTL